jgi:hypothetical protein
MRYLGNFKDWIRPEWLDYLINNDGTLRPKTLNENPNSEEFRIATTVGYNLNETWWHHYCETSCPLTVIPPTDADKEYMWWFIKLVPGGKMPMHRDPHVEEEGKENCTRYWMPLQDYEPGHIFIYKDSLISNYKKGDLYTYDDAYELHGAANIGYTNRLTFQYTVFNK